jgi:hypothetical protein
MDENYLCKIYDLLIMGKRNVKQHNIEKMGEIMIGGGKILSQMAVFHIIINKVLNDTMI